MSFKDCEISFRIGLYDIEKTIGKGNFSVVKLATHRLTMTKVAIKIIDKQKLSQENLMKIIREVEIMKKLHHPNIVKLYQVIETDLMLYMVMEYIPNGEIFELISEHGKISEVEARKLFSQMFAAVDHCHKNNVVHRDLKAENLLLDANMNIKLADFGFSNFFQTGELLSTWCGSPPYAAPEIFNGEKYVGPKVDVWSLGVVLYVLVAGALPFDEATLPRLRDQVLNQFPRIPFWLSDDCEDLIKSMLCKNPERRISLAKVKSHRWLMGEIGTSNSSRNLPILAEQMKIGDFNEVVIEYMESYGMNRGKIIESLKKCAYDNLTAIYLLLGDKLAQHRHSCPLTPELNPLRRSSAIAERVVLKRQMASLPQQLQQMHLQPDSQPMYTTMQAGFPNALYIHNLAQPMFYQQQISSAPAGGGVQLTADRKLSICSSVGSDSLHRDSIDSTASSLRFDSSRRDIIRTSIDEGVEVDFNEGGSGCRRHTVTGGDSGQPSGATCYPACPQPSSHWDPAWTCSEHVSYAYSHVSCFPPEYNLNRRASDGNMPGVDTQFIKNLRSADRANGMLHLSDYTAAGMHIHNLQDQPQIYTQSNSVCESSFERNANVTATSSPNGFGLQKQPAQNRRRSQAPLMTMRQCSTMQNRRSRPPPVGLKMNMNHPAMFLPCSELRDVNLSVANPIHEQSPEEPPNSVLTSCEHGMEVSYEMENS